MRCGCASALSEGQLGFTVASALLGTILGSIGSGSPAEKHGRRPVLQVLAVLYFVSAVGCAFAWGWWLARGVPLRGRPRHRRLLGGGAASSSPRSRPPASRGRLVALSQFNVVAGILVAYLSNYFIAGAVGGPESEAWRSMLGVPALPAALFYLFLRNIPESPRWLVKQHRRDEATAILGRLGNEDPAKLVAEIAESLHEETVAADEPFFQRKYRRPILLALMVASFNQLSGINALIYYTADIFAMAGAGRSSALLQSVTIGFTNLVFTLVAMTVIDRFGRRRLLLIGAARPRRLPGPVRLRLRKPARRHPRPGQPDRLHRLLRLLAGLGDLGLPLRDLPEPGAGPRPGPGQLHPLVLGGGGELVLPDDRRGVGGLRLRILRRDDAPAVRARVPVPARDQGRVAGADPAHARNRVMSRSLLSWMAALGLLVLPRTSAPAQDEPLRPQFHFSPARNFMNDPNGLVYFEGEYHLFYQHNPEGDRWGHMSWGHAVSPDLLHWKHLPVALREEDGIMVFSGSVVVDHEDRSGLCGGRPCLVAVYTGHTKDRQTQNLAASRDRGRTFTKYAGNPVLDLARKDFRDPKVFWHAPTARFVMVTVLPDEHKVRFFASRDLKRWEALSDFGPAGAQGGVWECPDLFVLPVEGEPGVTRWVLDVDLNPGGIAGGSGGPVLRGDVRRRALHE